MASSKLSGNVVTTTNMHLIWRLAGEGRVRNDVVVLLHIEGDELLQGREGVELVVSNKSSPPVTRPHDGRS
jgi:hypothetical protein